MQRLPSNAVYETELAGIALRARGKVRDIYDLDDSLLIVASDRLSAFDYVLPDAIPDKGKVLCQLSAFWFEASGLRRGGGLRSERGIHGIRGAADRGGLIAAPRALQCHCASSTTGGSCSRAGFIPRGVLSIDRAMTTTLPSAA